MLCYVLCNNFICIIVVRIAIKTAVPFEPLNDKYILLNLDSFHCNAASFTFSARGRLNVS